MQRTTRRALAVATALGAAAAAGAGRASAQAAPSPAPAPTPKTAPPPAAARPASGKPSIVLVHGAFADAMAWARVIPLLERDGYQVTAVELPLTSWEADVANARRVIRAQAGPVVVVGHSYGGAVITQAAAGEARVRALVYVAALAPDTGEAVAALLDKYPAPLSQALVPDPGGFLYVDRAKLRDVFALDLPAAETRVMAATQKPINGASFRAVPTAAAWKRVPSYFLVARQDRSISPELERFYARRMNATTVEVESSHVPFLSHPAEVARLIERAAADAVASRARTR